MKLKKIVVCPKIIGIILLLINNHLFSMFRIILFTLGVLTVSHLFWSGFTSANPDKPIRDGKKVLDCLKKALKIANQCMDTTVQVFRWFDS